MGMYISKVIKCIDTKLSVPGAPAVTGDWFITGHSLGGAAASLYKAATSFAAELVTFGAPPLFLDYDPASTKLKGEYEVDGGYLVSETTTPASVVSLPLAGTRYFHKFDPVPGYYFSSAGGLWDHAIKDSYMLYDTLDEDCVGGVFTYDPTAYTMADYDPTYVAMNSASDKYGKTIRKLKKFLCDSYSVKTNNWETSIENYYSYSNALTVFPCQETVFGAVMMIFGSVNGWTPYETIGECTATYVATVKAYGKTFSASGLKTQWTDRKNQYWLMMYSMWGLFWIHSTYPNYPMDPTDTAAKTVPAFWDAELPVFEK